MDAQDRARIEALLYRSFWLIDHGRAAESAALFAPDGSLTFGPGAPAPGTIRGADIAAAMTRRQAQSGVTSRHLLSNVQIEEMGEDRALMRSLLTLFRTESDDLRPDVKSVADVEDEMVRQGTEWKIARRTIMPVFTL